jgi:hypothetical protein
MAIGDLRSRDVHRFINGNRDEGGLWLFIHVPKTAGSSFRKELAETLRPQRNIHINYDSDEPFAQQMETAIARFLEADKYTYFRFASGHINMDQALLIRRNRPDTRIITFLRNPVDRVISDFRYQRTPAHPPYKNFIERYPTIDAYIADPVSQNRMSRILTPSHIDPADFDEVVNFLDQNVTFIGIQDIYPLSFSIMFGLLGMNRHPRVHERKTQSTDTNDVMLSEELQSRIRSINDLDHRLFRHYRQLLASIREQWHEYKIRANQPASEQ